jgi:hypothetical protein
MLPITLFVNITDLGYALPPLNQIKLKEPEKAKEW